MSLKLIIQGHPDLTAQHYCHALEQSYVDGVHDVGHEVKVINVSQLDFPLLHSEQEFEETSPSLDIVNSQALIKQASHIVIIFPLWLGTMPAMLKAFFEQIFRPGFGFDMSNPKKMPKKMLKGKSAHVFVTMGMPALMYKRYFGAHGIKNLEHNILRFSGIYPVDISYIGNIAKENPAKREKWLSKAHAFGQAVI